jgi:hypothetical protein
MAQLGCLTPGANNYNDRRNRTYELSKEVAIIYLISFYFMSIV